MAESVYKAVTGLYSYTYERINETGQGKGKNNTILMGSFVKVLSGENGDWQEIEAFGKKGWIKKTDLGVSPDFKCFYVDVGQGDGMLMEAGNDENGARILIDGGPAGSMHNYLNKWHYQYYIKSRKRIKIDHMFISHFDKDHYNGLIGIINDRHYEIGTIYHNGIAKFSGKKEKRPKEYNTGLGRKDGQFLVTAFSSIKDLDELEKKGGLQNNMRRFLQAVKAAQSQGRLKQMVRIDHKTQLQAKTINGKSMSIQVLGPVTQKKGTKLTFDYFEDESHTVNGHSLVLKITYGKNSFLFGGDLNIPSEEHLLKHYKSAAQRKEFRVDVAKSCHHGASEFTVDFLKTLSPVVTVISSGDNETYSHPRADAIGCAGKYSRSKRPLVFSTELARSTNFKANKIRFGMINLRSNGTNIIMAQMKEAHKAGDVWDLYEVPL